jgi:hypothetical protein
MPRLQKRFVSAGPFDNASYDSLRKIAKANDFATVEDMVGAMVGDMVGDDEPHIWKPIALDKAHWDYAVGRWGEEDARVLLDQVLGEAIEAEMTAKK